MCLLRHPNVLDGHADCLGSEFCWLTYELLKCYEVV